MWNNRAKKWSARVCVQKEKRKAGNVCHHIPQLLPHAIESLYSQMFVVGKIIIGLWSVFKTDKSKYASHTYVDIANPKLKQTTRLGLLRFFFKDEPHRRVFNWIQPHS